MITLYNDKLTEDMQIRYRKLFNNAHRDLVNFVDPKDNTKPYSKVETFNSLSDYYAHMVDYIAIGKPIYILLPLDEGHFEIDANSREITVPKEFAKCGGVTNDNLCEIATFTIDRYYDYVDLAGEKVHIVVEWRNAAGEEGVTGINLIDLDTFFDTGKIRFGWPLGLEITKKEGPVTFAVKFFMRDPEDPKKLIHVLNTLPATINIKKGLTISDTSLYDAPKDYYNTIESIVVNSKTIDDMPSGVKFIYYSWNNPGVIQESAKLADDTLELIAEGFNIDQREMEYEWYRAPWEQDLSGEWKINDQKETKIIPDNVTYAQSFKYDELLWDRETNTFPIQYALYKEDKTRYTQNDWPESKEEKLYTRRSCLTFVKDSKADITGRYYAKAYNRVYEADGETIKGEASKKTPYCYIYKPDKLEYTEKGNLASEGASLSKGAIRLQVEFVSSEKDPDVTHSWKRYSTLAAAEADTNFSATENCSIVALNPDNEDKDTDFYSSRLVDTAGYYRVLTSNTLNRDTQIELSEICKVTGEIKAPQLTPEGSIIAISTDSVVLQDVNAWINNEDTDKKTWLNTSEIQTFSVDYGNVIYLKIIPTPMGELETDGFEYKWSYSLSDNTQSPTYFTKDTKINDATILQSSVDEHSDSIVLKCVWEDGAVCSVYCEVFNTLTGEKAGAIKQSVAILNRMPS